MRTLTALAVAFALLWLYVAFIEEPAPDPPLNGSAPLTGFYTGGN